MPTVSRRLHHVAWGAVLAPVVSGSLTTMAVLSAGSVLAGLVSWALHLVSVRRDADQPSSTLPTR